MNENKHGLGDEKQKRKIKKKSRAAEDILGRTCPLQQRGGGGYLYMALQIGPQALPVIQKHRNKNKP